MHISKTMRAARSAIALVAAGVASVGLYTCGGSSPGSGPGAGSDYACSLSVAGQEYCYAYSNLTAESASSARTMCSNQGGKAVSSCPTDGLVGCCALTQSGVSYQSCYYFGTASADEMACSAANGKWTAGSGALGGGGGKGGGTGSGTGGGPGGGRGGASGSGGGSTGSSCTGSGLCCPENYCTMGSAHGYQFAYSDRNDGGGSSAQITSPSCVTGTAVGADCTTASSPDTCYSTHWGAGIGFNLNQATGEGTTPMNFTSAGSGGVTYAVDRLLSNVRMVVGDSTTDYCANLTASSGTIPWSGFSSSCWNTTGSYLSGPPSKLVSVRFQVVADTSYAGFSSFDFCVTRLSL
jgi:hypothetical protein